MPRRRSSRLNVPMWIPQQWPTDVMLLIWTLGSIYLLVLFFAFHTGYISIQICANETWLNIILTCAFFGYDRE